MTCGNHLSLKLKQCFVHSHLSFTSGTIPETPQPPPQLAGNVCRSVLCSLRSQWSLILGMTTGREWPEMSLGPSIPAPAGILSLSPGSLDELTVIVTSNDLEWHWLPLLYVLLFYPLIKLKNQMSQWFIGCRGWFCTVAAPHLLAELWCVVCQRLSWVSNECVIWCFWFLIIWY